MDERLGHAIERLRTLGATAIVLDAGVIGADGRIVKIWRNVKVDGHAEEVLAAARGS